MSSNKISTDRRARGARVRGGEGSSSSSSRPPPPVPISTSDASYPSDEDVEPRPPPPVPISIPTSRVPGGTRGTGASARIKPGNARIPSVSTSTGKGKAPLIPPKVPGAKSPTVRSPTVRSPTVKAPTVKSRSARSQKIQTNVSITDSTSMSTDDWVNLIQAKVNDILSYIEPDQNKRNRFIDSEAMKMWTKAFTHETVNYTNNNKTLETLGDAVLRLYFLNYLMEKFPNLGQSGYTNLINFYQDRERQGDMSRKYGLYDLIHINPKAIRDNKLAGDIYEAFFGALFKVGDYVLPGLGGVLTNNLIVYLYNKEGVDIKKTQKDPKSAIIQMFNKFRSGDEAKTNYSKAIQNASSMIKEGNTYIYTLILPREVNQFLSDYGIEVDPNGDFTYENGDVIIGEGRSNDSKEADLTAYKSAYDVLGEAGFTPEKAEQIKRDMDFDVLDQNLVKEAEDKAKESNLELYFGTPKGEVSTVLLKGRLRNGEDIELVKYSYNITDGIVDAREQTLRKYLEM